MPYRAGVQYQNRLNCHSQQFFAPKRSHVWCESALEAEALLVLDFEGGCIAAQPMNIIFADGPHHFPDFSAVLRNRHQVVYDVKPSGRMTADTAAQFSKIAAVCDPDRLEARGASTSLLHIERCAAAHQEVYGGIEYGGLPVSHCILHLMNNRPTPSRPRACLALPSNGSHHSGSQQSWRLSRRIWAHRDMHAVAARQRHPSRRVRQRDRSASSTEGSRSGNTSPVISRCRMRPR